MGKSGDIDVGGAAHTVRTLWNNSAQAGSPEELATTLLFHSYCSFSSCGWMRGVTVSLVHHLLLPLMSLTCAFIRHTCGFGFTPPAPPLRTAELPLCFYTWINCESWLKKRFKKVGCAVHPKVPEVQVQVSRSWVSWRPQLQRSVKAGLQPKGAHITLPPCIFLITWSVSERKDQKAESFHSPGAGESRSRSATQRYKGWTAGTGHWSLTVYALFSFNLFGFFLFCTLQ